MLNNINHVISKYNPNMQFKLIDLGLIESSWRRPTPSNVGIDGIMLTRWKRARMQIRTWVSEICRRLKLLGLLQLITV
jgi:hypothetical protein